MTLHVAQVFKKGAHESEWDCHVAYTDATVHAALSQAALQLGIITVVALL